ncbi:hypothetical protein [Parasphingorhabdus sp.]|uniref:hypothetical protein n=1 Tax=Parasphingorhabdus sp. TaxID=2709688 RepID=UPI003266FB4B
MLKKTTVLLIVLFAVGAGYLLWVMERDLSQRTQNLTTKTPYWSCEQLPSKGGLARVFASSVIREQGYDWSGFHWTAGYFLYSKYYNWRLNSDDLIDNFLKTPTRREKNCTQIGKDGK